MPSWFQMAFLLAEFAYWIAMIIFVGYAVIQLKRWVNFQLGVGASGQLRKDAAAKADTDVSVDEFVE